MNATVYHYGPPDVLKYEQVEAPAVGDNEVLINVRAASVNPLDWKTLNVGPYFVRMLFGLRKPKIKIPGVDVAGLVEAAGRNATQFKKGDQVFGVCRGVFAEYCTSASAFGMKSALALKPDNITFEQAASAPVAALTALQGLRDKGHIKPGQKVLINGASGGVGTFAVQIAKSYGATVTAVCSTKNVAMVQSIGADHVIDYTQEDFTKRDERYDIFFDCIGNHSLLASRRILNPKGILVMAGVPSDVKVTALLARLIAAFVLSCFMSRKMIMFIAKANQTDLTVIATLMATGKITPVIDKCYNLDQVPEALQYLKAGHVPGKLVITF